MSTTGVAPAGTGIAAAVLGTQISAQTPAFTGFPVFTTVVVSATLIVAGVALVVFGRDVIELPIRQPGDPAWMVRR